MLGDLARIFHESLAAITDMAVLPGVLGCRPLRRTVQVRLGTNPAVPRDGCQVARPSSSRSLRSVPQAGSQFRDLATAIHEIPWLCSMTAVIEEISKWWQGKWLSTNEQGI